MPIFLRLRKWGPYQSQIAYAPKNFLLQKSPGIVQCIMRTIISESQDTAVDCSGVLSTRKAGDTELKLSLYHNQYFNFDGRILKGLCQMASSTFWPAEIAEGSKSQSNTSLIVPRYCSQARKRGIFLTAGGVEIPCRWPVEGALSSHS